MRFRSKYFGFCILRNGGFNVNVGQLSIEASAYVSDTPRFRHGWFDISWGEDIIISFGKP